VDSSQELGVSVPLFGIPAFRVEVRRDENPGRIEIDGAALAFDVNGISIQKT